MCSIPRTPTQLQPKTLSGLGLHAGTSPPWSRTCPQAMGMPRKSHKSTFRRVISRAKPYPMAAKGIKSVPTQNPVDIPARMELKITSFISPAKIYSPFLQFCHSEPTSFTEKQIHAQSKVTGIFQQFQQTGMARPGFLAPLPLEDTPAVRRGASGTDVWGGKGCTRIRSCSRCLGVISISIWAFGGGGGGLD